MSRALHRVSSDLRSPVDWQERFTNTILPEKVGFYVGTRLVCYDALSDPPIRWYAYAYKIDLSHPMWERAQVPSQVVDLTNE